MHEPGVVCLRYYLYKKVLKFILVSLCVCVGAHVCITIVFCLYFCSSVRNFLLPVTVTFLGIFTEEIHMVLMGVNCLPLPLHGRLLISGIFTLIIVVSLMENLKRVKSFRLTLLACYSQSSVIH